MDKSAPMPDAPPSYDQSMGQVGGAGGFAPPPQPMEGAKGPMPGAVPPAQPYVPPTAMPAGAMYAQPGAVPVQPGQQQQVVVVVNPPNFGPNPVDMVCPHCQCQIRTTTESEPGPLAWIFAGVLCVVGLWPCACIPCCIESLNSVTHKCPNCKNFLGRYKGGM